MKDILFVPDELPKVGILRELPRKRLAALLDDA